MRSLVIILAVSILASCAKSNPSEIAAQLELYKESEQPADCRWQVYVFLQPDCPLSQDQSRTLARLAEDPRLSEFCFTGFFAGRLYTRDEFEDFILHYPVPYHIRLDPELQMAGRLGATVVPEVFVTGEEGEVLYQGAINDWAVREGSKKDEPTRHYLRDALLALSRGEKPPVSKTKAVGCILE